MSKVQCLCMVIAKHRKAVEVRNSKKKKKERKKEKRKRGKVVKPTE